jgi:type I restriction enzyme S subunit
MRASTTQRWLTEGGSDARGGVYSGERRWPTASLAEACEKITDGTHRSPPNGGHGVPYITAKNIRRFEIDLTELTYVSEEHHREIYSRCDPRLGDVLYIKDGATMGIAAINTLNYEFSLLSSVALLRPRADLLRADYLTYWLNHPDTYRRVRETQAGSAIQRMVLDQIRNMSIPLPPLSEQERIGAWLTRALGAVTVARKAASDRLAAAEALSPALFRESFGGTPTFDASPLMPSVPAQPGWMWHRLTSLARLATGHTPSRRRPDYWVGNIPWIQLPDIRALDGRTAMDTSEHTNALGVENSAAVLLPSGTVCLSRTASVGFVTILGREMATSQDFVNWVCGPDWTRSSSCCC